MYLTELFLLIALLFIFIYFSSTLSMDKDIKDVLYMMYA